MEILLISFLMTALMACSAPHDSYLALCFLSSFLKLGDFWVLASLLDWSSRGASLPLHCVDILARNSILTAVGDSITGLFIVNKYRDAYRA